MIIYTLGTSHGATEPGRACSGTLFSVNGANYLFDCGGPVEGKMTDLGLSIEDIRCVFISHMHEDHVGNLSAIAKRFCVYNQKETSVRILMPEENGICAFKTWLSALHLSFFDKVHFELVTAGVIYSDENITVTAIPTEHINGGEFPSFAYMVECGEKRILYTGDLASDFHDYPQIALETMFDVILCELVHFRIQYNLDTLIQSKTKKMIFTHLSPHQIPHLKAVEHRFPFPIDIAQDNLFYEL